jgi:hypothetical protein
MAAEINYELSDRQEMLVRLPKALIWFCCTAAGLQALLNWQPALQDQFSAGLEQLKMLVREYR